MNGGHGLHSLEVICSLVHILYVKDTLKCSKVGYRSYDGNVTNRWKSKRMFATLLNSLGNIDIVP